MNFFKNLKRRSASTSKAGASTNTASANLIKSTAGPLGTNGAGANLAGAAAPADRPTTANNVKQPNKYHRNSGVVAGTSKPPMITVNQMKSSTGGAVGDAATPTIVQENYGQNIVKSSTAGKFTLPPAG